MTFTEKHIVESYSVLLEGLSADSKTELIESLSKSLKADKNKDKNFYNSFGAFGSSKPPKEIIKEIRKSRKFRKKEISF